MAYFTQLIRSYQDDKLDTQYAEAIAQKRREPEKKPLINPVYFENVIFLTRDFCRFQYGRGLAIIILTFCRMCWGTKRIIVILLMRLLRRHILLCYVSFVFVRIIMINYLLRIILTDKHFHNVAHQYGYNKNT